MNNKKIRPFGIRDEIGYTFGDIGGSFVNIFVDSFFLTFCTYVLGISAGWMAGLFLVARLWDAINDPIIGSFPDRWHIGKTTDKFKPYIKLFVLPLALSGILCFLKVPFTGIALYAWVAFVYILCGMCYTGTSMPYGAMASVISDNPLHRAALSRDRSIGGMLVGMTFISLVAAVCFDSNNNILPERFTLMGIVAAIGCIISYTITLHNCEERIHQLVRKENYNYGKVLKQAFHNRQLIGAMVATIGSCMYLTCTSQLRNYIYIEYYADTKALSFVSLANMPLTLICFPFIPKLIQKLGKRTAVLGGAIFSLVVYGFLLFVPIQNAYIYSIINLTASIGQIIFVMCVWALVTDCLDYGEWKDGERNDGSFYSIFTFARKLGNTISSSVSASALTMVGYVSGMNIVQTSETVAGIRILVCIMPVIAAAIEIIGVGFIFTLDQKTTDQMYAELAERHRSGETE